MKKKIFTVILLIFIALSFRFSSELYYLTELVSTIYKIKRTEADITDYKYFNNIEIPKSTNPQPWPFQLNNIDLS